MYHNVVKKQNWLHAKENCYMEWSAAMGVPQYSNLSVRGCPEPPDPPRNVLVLAITYFANSTCSDSTPTTQNSRSAITPKI